ncbi:MAG: indolepyruvate ferredoxin oxidoreductase subunit alpha [Clostridia bacterium]
MAIELLMGNVAIGLGAIRAGVGVVTGYPGTPSTEVLETIAKNNDGNIYVEWSVNEKSAMEVAAGACYSGKRTLVTMKQVGLNVASDPLMNLSYIGVKGGLVVLVADDPGPISSQTEQDTRSYGMYSKLPVFDPSTPEEAYLMMADAFDYSEKYNTPVIFRPVTRLCHACSAVDLKPQIQKPSDTTFEKNPRFVIFPKLAYNSHLNIEKRNPIIGDDFSSYKYNIASGKGEKAIVTGSVSYSYVKEFLDEDVKLLKIATPFPFPEKLALEFLDTVKEVLVIEELDPVLERALIHLAGKEKLSVKIKGKLTGDVQTAGENSPESVNAVLNKFLGLNNTIDFDSADDIPLPIRPPVLCAGCPHRASFYAVKQAMKGKRAVYCGDIGCYTLGNAMPLDMVDTCLCMGAGITIAQGIKHSDKDIKAFSFIGDSTFFAAGITGIVNAIYNGADITVVILDNSTTAMTGHQPHPGTGITMMGDIAQKMSIEKVLEGLGVPYIRTVDPLNLSEAIEVAKEASNQKGVSAIIYRSPCIAVVKGNKKTSKITDKCVSCGKCIKEIGCPAIMREGKKVYINQTLCTNCKLCHKVCPFDAIKEVNS